MLVIIAMHLYEGLLWGMISELQRAQEIHRSPNVKYTMKADYGSIIVQGFAIYDSAIHHLGNTCCEFTVDIDSFSACCTSKSNER